MSLKRSINSSSVQSRHSPSGMPLKLTFIMRVRSSFSLRNQSARTCDESDGSAPHQGNAEDKAVLLFLTFAHSYRPEDRYSRPHTTNTFVGNRFINRHQILFLMIVTRTEDLIHQIAVIGEENQPLGIFIQAANQGTRVLLWLTESTMLSRSPSSGGCWQYRRALFRR